MRIDADKVKKVTAKLTFTMDNGDEIPAGLAVEMEDGMQLAKENLLDTIRKMHQSFIDLLEESLR